MSKLFHYISPILLLLLSCEEGPFFEVPDEQDSIPPTVTLTFPPDQATLSDTVTVSAYAFDNLELEIVYIYLNDSAILAQKEGPYEYSWITTTAAEDEYHTLYAKAKDLAGNINRTNPIQVLVDNVDNVNPTGTIIYPFTGQTLSNEITIIVEADDNEEVAFVNIYIEGDTVATLTESPYTHKWNTMEEVDDITYTIHVHVQDVAGNQITLGPISVLIDNYEAEDNIPPTGNITNPASASTVSGTIDIEVTAYDNVEMGFVDFIIDGSPAGQDNTSPYTHSWNTTESAEDADHTINVNITDAAGNSTALFPITVRVNNIEEPDVTDPTVVMYEPAANQTVSGTVNITAIALDNVGINRVEFYHNYVLETTINSYPYTYEWNSTAVEDDSEHTWYVKAFDTSENDAQTQPIAVYVNNDDNIPPTGFFLYPYAGQTVNEVIEIQVSASDNVGIEQVEFFVEGSSIGIDTGDPFIFSWDTETGTEDEEHVLGATIKDLGGNETDIAPISVLVNNVVTPGDDTTPPVVAILTPVSGQTVGDSVFISAFASDNMGIQDVKFFIDEELAATVTDSPYTHLWGTYDLANGSEHAIQMTASDLSGNITTAQPVSVTVQNEYEGEIENLSLSISEETVSLSWDAPYDAVTFKIYRDTVFLAQTDNQSYDDSVSGGIEYCYQVSAINGVGIEGPSSSESCGIPLLRAPETFSATIFEDTVTLIWDGLNHASGYIIERDDFEIWNGTELTLTDTGLAFNTVYLYTITAYDSLGTNGTESDPLSVTTHEEMTAPTLSLSVSDSIGTLTWTSVSSASAYRVFRDSTFIEEVTATSFEIEMEGGVSTCFFVTAINEYGSESDPSNQECEVPTLPAPASFSATINDTNVTLVWSAVDNAAGYTIERDDTEIWTGESLTMTDSGLAYNTTFIYTVTAYDFEGTQGETSDPLSVNMPEELTPPVLALSISGTDGSLSWTSVSSATGYRVFKDSVFVTETTNTDYETEMTHSIEACFSVIAINQYGSESDPSNEECGTGDFTPPVLSLTITDSTATLNWSSVLSAENYKVYQDSIFLLEITDLTYDVEIGTADTTCFNVSGVNAYGTESDQSNEECGAGS